MQPVVGLIMFTSKLDDKHFQIETNVTVMMPLFKQQKTGLI